MAYCQECNRDGYACRCIKMSWIEKQYSITPQDIILQSCREYNFETAKKLLDELLTDGIFEEVDQGRYIVKRTLRT